MKQIIQKLRFVILAIAGTLLPACAGLEMPGPASIDTSVSVTTSICLDADAPVSKALNPATGAKTFAPGDKVALIYTDTDDQSVIAECTLASSDIKEGGKSAALTFSLNNPKEGMNQVNFVYPAFLASSESDDGIDMFRLQNSQDGTLASLSGRFDAAVANGVLSVSGGNAVLPASIPLSNPLSICAFSLREGTTDINDRLIRLTISDGTNSYIINRKAEASPIYVAMKPVEDQTIRLVGTDGLEVFAKDAPGQTLAANTLYPIGVSANKTEDRSIPLTFEAKTDGSRVYFHPASGLGISVQYSLNDGNWTSISTGTYITLEQAGDRVSFRGNNSAYAQHQAYSTPNSYFACEGECYVYGNVMSLVSAEGFATATSITESYAFYRLFQGEGILSHDTKPLLLPATQLDTFCYDSMFQGCTDLTHAPALPATSLGQYCYQNMFKDCTSLADAPALPATDLQNACYKGMFLDCSSLQIPPALPAETVKKECYMFMFQNCTSLIAAPSLPAEVMANSCYNQMFQGCTSLTQVPQSLPATTLAYSCYHNMFSDCSNLVVAPELPATSLESSCYSGMFSGCSELTEAPVLRATVLKTESYYYMFNHCKKLNSVTCLATNISASDCTKGWLTDVAATGTVVKAAGMNDWTVNSANGIPTDWTTVDYVPVP